MVILSPSESRKFYNFIKNFFKGKRVTEKFFRWYIYTQFGKEAEDGSVISDKKGDGKLDAIVTVEKMRYVIQSKLFKNSFNGKTSGVVKDELIVFQNAIRNYDGNKKEFQKYLVKEVRKELHPAFVKLHNYYKNHKKNVKFEFITTHGKPKDLPKLVELHEEDIFYYDYFERLYKSDIFGRTPPAKPMTLNLLPLEDDGNGRSKKYSTFMFKDDVNEVNSWLLRVPVNDFIDYMPKDPNLNCVSANVRMDLKSGINDGIENSFRKNSKYFWYLHNGIYLISDKVIKKGDSVTLIEPNIINGSQTVLTLRGVPKKDNASILVRITERNGGGNNEKLIQEIIEGTNSQNKTFLYDLKANDPLQVKLYREFFKKDIFYKRRRGEWEEWKIIGKYTDKIPLDIKKLGQILLACKNGAKGVIILKKDTEGIFAKEHPLNNDKKLKTKITYKKTFGGSFKEIYFKYLLFSFLEAVFSQIRLLPGKQKKYLKFTIYALLWNKIKGNKSKLSNWQNKSYNSTENLFVKKNKKSKNFVKDIITIFEKCDKEFLKEEQKAQSKMKQWERKKKTAKRNKKKFNEKPPDEVTRKLFVNNLEFNQKIFSTIQNPRKDEIIKHIDEIFK